jgi:hypothetical protein
MRIRKPDRVTGADRGAAHHGSARQPALAGKGAASGMDRIELNVTINGTDVNPWHRFRLRQNPFPQIGKAEYAAGERQLASLDGDPVRAAEDIRERLAGFAPEFVEGVIRRWQPGRRVTFKIVFPAGRNTPEPSGELSKGDVVAVGEIALAVARVGWTVVRGGTNEVRTDGHGTHPLPAPAAPGGPLSGSTAKEHRDERR